MRAEIYHTSDATAFANFAKTARKAPKPSAPDCEVTVLAVRLGAAMQMFEAMQAQPITEENRIRIKQAEEKAWDETCAIQEMIANVQANSALGATVQIAAALDRFEMVWDSFPEAEQNYRVKQDARAIRRLLHSALDFYDSIAVRKLADIAPDLGARHFSPWVSVKIATAAE